MGSTMIAVIGFVSLAILMWVLLKGMTSPVIPFILIPVVTALIAGFSIGDINGFVKSGLSSVLSTAAMFMFSITYFNIMNDAGLFEPVIRALTPKGKANVFLILLSALAVTYVGHLDGSGATTWMIVLTAFLPLADRVGIRRPALLCVAASGMTAANLVPWGGPTMRAAAVLEMDVNALFTYILPALAVMVGLSVLTVWMLARAEVKNGAGTMIAGPACAAEDHVEPGRGGFKDWKWIFNMALTVAVLYFLFSGVMSSYLCFMLGVSVALLVNYPNPKEQTKRLKSYAGQSMVMTITLFAVAVFLGVMKEGGFIEAMASVIVRIIPGFLAPHAHWVLALIAVPMMMALGTDAFYYVMLPVIIGVVEPFGISALSVAAVYLITGTFGSSINPSGAAMYVGLGLADVDVGTHIKFSIRYLWPFSIACMAAAILMGIVQF